MDQQNAETGSHYQTNSFNNNNPGNAHGNSGQSGTIWAGDNYASPWDIWNRNVRRKQPSYLFNNGNSEFASPYKLKVFAYVGLAYFDGDDDGVFHDPVTGAAIPLATNLGGNYPNLYGGNSTIPGQGQEAGKLVRITNFFDIGAYPQAGWTYRVESETFHLARKGQPQQAAHPGMPGEDDGFFFGQLTGPERDLLYEYGKVFFYEVEVYDKFTGSLVTTALLHPEIKTLPTGSDPDQNWQPVLDSWGNHSQGNAPALGTLDLYYYNDLSINGTVWNINGNPSNGQCDSHEIVFDVPQSLKLHKVDIDGTYKLSLDFLQNSLWLWQNSALYLHVTL
ncbi:hypothetical protein [Paenimyroides aestuarii]|uniref:Uncharacterized protein n=1 Tax=Paenimyroides aestuarii TaxID=2968490 RepID=A0ABY5NQM7_9FLAO|nr:hypothetical protein [Paenimyroides aestuarii]UUV20742.1 hypothetical protein NPX36_10395 [Paenimyroides aestuarii]